MKNTIYWHRFLQKLKKEFKNTEFPPKYFGEFMINDKIYRIILDIKEHKKN